MAPKKLAPSKTVADPRKVVISQNEYNTGVTNLDNVQAGVEELQTHGFVILENAIAENVTEKLYGQMQADAATSLKSPNLVFNHGNERNNFSIIPPLSDDFLVEDIWANRHATAIMEQIIGPRPILCWVGSNIAIQSSAAARQAVHSDAYADIPKFPFSIEMNIFLQDTDAANGSTEIWPGSHLFTEDDHLPAGRGFINKKSFNARARISPPIQPIIPAGSILMRDLRLWHAGMPNTTATPRIVIGLLYFPQWFRPLMRLTLSDSVRPKANSWTHIDLLSNTDFVEGPVDHLRTCFPMNFTQDPAKAMVPYRRAKDAEQGRTPGAAIAVTKDNFWTRSNYQTRAAGKRTRDAKEDDDGEGKGQKKVKINSEPERKAKAEANRKTKSNAKSEVKLEVESKGKPNAKPKVKRISKAEIKPAQGPEDEPEGHEIEQAQELKGPERPWLVQAPEIAPVPYKETLGDLPDYDDSPGYLPDWMKKLPQYKVPAEGGLWNDDSGDYDGPCAHNYAQYFPKPQPRVQEEHTENDDKTGPKLGTKQSEGPLDYNESSTSEQTIEDYSPAEQAWISEAQEATFKINFVPFTGSGPGISPVFSPKSNLGPPHKPRTAHEAKFERKSQTNFYGQQLVPVAKMISSPEPQTSSPKILSDAPTTREPSPQPYQKPYSPTLNIHPPYSPSQSLIPHPSRPPAPPHVSQYYASHTATSSPLMSYTSTQHPSTLSAEPGAISTEAPELNTPPKPSATPARDAYDAYIQAQLLERQEQELAAGLQSNNNNDNNNKEHGGGGG